MKKNYKYEGEWTREDRHHPKSKKVLVNNELYKDKHRKAIYNQVSEIDSDLEDEQYLYEAS